MKEIFRTRIKKDIVAECIPPQRALKRNRVLIVAGGMPSVPKQNEVLEYWSQKNYWVIFPRYRGSWESGGEFLNRSPAEDIADIVRHISQQQYVRDSARNVDVEIRDPHIYVIGVSFGGPAALFASSIEEVRSVVVLSSVIDWRGMEGGVEPMKWLGLFVREAFGMGYRFKMSNWKRLASNKLYSPVLMPDNIEFSKCYLIHARDDDVVPVSAVDAFLKTHAGKHTILKTGGHFGMRATTERAMCERIIKHFKQSV